MRPRSIAEQFCPLVTELEPLGNGLINDTYLIQTDRQPFVLQKINRQVFQQPELIMANLSAFNEYIAARKVNEIALKIPELIRTESGAYSVIDENGDYWRAWAYVANTDCLETLNNLTEAGQVGTALGKFHRLGYGMNIAQFFDTLPGFHIAPKYFEQYRQIEAATKIAANDECRDFIESYHHIIHDLEDAKNQGLLKLRVTHGDPKLNNFLFDKDTRQIVSLIDLDTVKPGLIHYDIGDCLRSCCHNDMDDSFDLEICKAVLTGYVNEMGALLSESDYRYLFAAIRLIPFELGLRFYTDYLNGNLYFKVTEPQQNLFRSLKLVRLCKDILNKNQTINDIINKLAP